ncbi:hypothetical protein MSBRW_2633 [Methanosarcina barkeri str. Wiesmoor]|uniref:Uncharacterized protein n=1 Tax=Methanosarcina barkeri str. Wiesmoor TaxID=1434109 RepID=A0A0E3LLU6_METBA|nr:hypothetical protein MSBRW_2633 [Methanosarcina barkeri str. Wiesmoor]
MEFYNTENTASCRVFDLDITTTENTESMEEPCLYYYISVSSMLSVVFKKFIFDIFISDILWNRCSS